MRSNETMKKKLYQYLSVCFICLNDPIQNTPNVPTDRKLITHSWIVWIYDIVIFSFQSNDHCDFTPVTNICLCYEHHRK
ncbi:hypothetical protein DERF_011358 [Dermatophagoides farinae]|uniref:Uncharacterized protein n=1 Tax=Dermatophagoides farinae TaxID=6954 RepID=A0A922L4Q0_DERFA|nr:hypothetical protein DERF_011358 [Dermatophagoides farinae]